MSASPVRAPKTLVHHEPEHPGDRASSILIGLSESSKSTVAWRLRIEAITSGGRARLGTIVTAPPSSMRLGGRVVALASCPGALAWDILVTPVSPYASDVGCYLKIESCREAATLGLVPCDGSIAIAGPDGAGAFNQDAGVGVGSTAIPVGAKVQGWSVIAGAAPATVQITSPFFGALPLITVPTGGSMSDSPAGLGGGAIIAFGGSVASRWVSWLELIG